MLHHVFNLLMNRMRFKAKSQFLAMGMVQKHAFWGQKLDENLQLRRIFRFFLVHKKEKLKLKF